VFSWSAALLTSITGGIIVATRGIENFHLQVSDQVLLTIIILITTVYSWLMIRENLIFESKIRDQLEQLFAEKLEYPQLKDLRPDKARFGYKHAIVLLGIVAVIATWTGSSRFPATNGQPIQKTGKDTVQNGFYPVKTDTVKSIQLLPSA
jgi:hypothetical protein